MYSVKIELGSVRDGEKASASVAIEERRGSGWTRSEVRTILSGEPEAKRSLVLRNDQRVVIEGKSDVEVRFDPVQNAAVPMKVSRELEEGELEEQRRREIEEAEAAEHERLKALDQAKRKLKERSRASN